MKQHLLLSVLLKRCIFAVQIDFVGYFLALIIGVVLGLIGGGGSILAVPVLVYVLGVTPVLATAYSLFIVGVASFFGAIRHFRMGNVAIRMGILFATPAFMGVYVSRKWLLPALPDQLAHIGTWVITKDAALMLFFALIMLGAAISMIFVSRSNTEKNEQSIQYVKVIVEGLFVGLLTGLVGAGGGFLIIPALVLLAGLPMKKAIGTSLMIISIKSLIGFLGEWETEIDWLLLGAFSTLTIIGIYIGSHLTKQIDGSRLKQSFGVLILLMAVLIIFKETTFFS